MTEIHPAAEKRLTGRHVLAIAVAAFAIIIAANLTMLFAATGSFPGLVVKNAYVAGQGWDARAASQRALGWAPQVAYRAGQVEVVLEGASPADLERLELTALIGRATRDDEDRRVALTGAGRVFAAPVDLAPGLWRVEIASQAGPAFQATAKLAVSDLDRTE